MSHKVDDIDTASVAHIASDGSDHSFIDQDVTNGAAPVLAVTNMTGSAAGLDSDATTHAGADGSSHTFIDQDVTSGAAPVLADTNLTGSRLPVARVTLGAASSLAADVIGATTETAHTAIALTSAMMNTARRWIKWKALVYVVGDNVADTWTIKARLGGLGGILLANSTAKDIAADDIIELSGSIFVATNGGAGAATLLCEAGIVGSGNFATPVFTQLQDGVNPDLTISNDLVITGECSSNNAGNIVQLAAFEAVVLPA